MSHYVTIGGKGKLSENFLNCIKWGLQLRKLLSIFAQFGVAVTFPTTVQKSKNSCTILQRGYKFKK